MNGKHPKVNLDIIIERDNKILLGLLTKKWSYGGRQVYGVLGRDIWEWETFEEAIKRDIKQEIDCEVLNYEVFCVNPNYALGNHYIGIGIKAEIIGEPKLLFPEDWEKWDWFRKDEIPNNLFPSAKNLINCYLYNKINVSN